MQSISKQLESNAIAAYVRARHTGATRAQLRVVSTLPVSASARTAKARFARMCSKAGLAELAVAQQIPLVVPFVSADTITAHILVARTYARAAQVQKELAE